MERVYTQSIYDDSEPKTSSDSEEAQLMGGKSTLLSQRKTRANWWFVAGSVLFLIVYTPLVMIATRFFLGQDHDLTYGGKIIKCEPSIFLLVKFDSNLLHASPSSGPDPPRDTRD